MPPGSMPFQLCVCSICHSQLFSDSGAQSTDWLLAGARFWGLGTELLLPPKLVPSCRRLMWRITAVALKACCKETTRHKCELYGRSLYSGRYS